jgi:hypothetical protein
MHPRTWLTSLALIVAACASPAPTPSPTASPAPAPVLQVGGLARIAADVQPELGPEDPPDTAIPPLPLRQGDLVYLIDGPRQDGDRSLWQVVDNRTWVGALGWVPAADANGQPLLDPDSLECPDISTVIDVAVVSSIQRIGRLACFGNQEFAMVGAVNCSSAAIDFPYGTSAPWGWRDFICLVGGIDGDGFQVAGDVLYDLALAEPNRLLRGTYVLTAHVDDPASADCQWIPGTYGYTPLDQPYTASAVMSCRTSVIVTAAVPVTNQ